MESGGMVRWSLIQHRLPYSSGMPVGVKRGSAATPLAESKNDHLTYHLHCTATTEHA